MTRKNVNPELRRETAASASHDQKPQESRALLCAILEAFDGLIYVVTRDYRIEYLNPAAVKRLGKEATGEICHRALYGLDKPCDWCQMDRVLAGDSVPLEIQDPRDGRWFRGVASLIRRAGDNLAQLSILRDVTGAKALEQALRNSQANFEAIADNAGEGIFVTDNEKNHLYVNRQAEVMTGYTRDELLKLGPRDLVPPDQWEIMVHRLYERLAGDETPRVYETILVRKDGTHIPIEVASTRTTWMGKTASIAFVRDIRWRKMAESELRQSEEMFSKAFYSNPTPVIITLAGGQFVEVNDAFLRATEFTRDEVIGKTPVELGILTPEDRENKIAQPRRKDGVLRGAECRFRTKSGQMKTGLLSGDAITLGGQTCWLTAVEDITRRKEMETAFNNRARELNCLLQITEIVETHRGCLEEILQKIADLLPDSWQHAHVACGCIVLRNHRYTSRNFRRSPWKLAAEIVVDEHPVGRVEVYYRRKMPDADEGPFTWEEHRLLNAVAERLAGVVRRVEADQELQKERQALRESNIAMRELMARIQDEKREVAQAMQNNVDTVILPILEDLHSRLGRKHQRLVDLLRFNLEEITSPFVDKVSRAFQNLSPAELRVCDMIRRGLSSKEIAHVLHISPSTVSRHREHIRQKLELTNKGTNLVSHLNAMISSRTAEG